MSSPHGFLSRKRWLTKNVFYISLTSLLSDASHEMATAILPLFLTVQLGAGPGVLGLIEGASDGFSSLTKSFSGYLSDRSGKRKPVMNLGYAVTGALISAIGLAITWPQVLVLRVLGWMGRGARGPPRDALLSESVEADVRGTAFGFQRALDTIGATLGPALALVFIQFFSYRDVFFISFVPGLMAFLVVLLLVKEIKNRPKRVPSGPVGTQDKGFIASLKGLPRPFKLYLLGVGVFGLGNFANSLFTLRAQEVLSPRMGVVSAGVVAVGLYTLLNLVYAAACVPVGVISDRVGRRRVLAAGYIISAAASVLAAYLTGDFLLLVPTFALAGLFNAITDTVEGAAAADLLPSDVRGTGYGLLQTVNGIGDFTSSFVVGLLWTLISPAVAFTYAAILCAAGALVLAYLTRFTLS